ncbi:MAG: hypothetical protein DMD78_02965 [Candidatus Rokuibacteriota bacterium]|nr:MAG: hypothetical protein DMD78_02965 [Candidatus Rokubacteria bacterium]
MTSEPRRLSRRHFIGTAAAGVGAAVALDRAPAVAQTRELTFLTVASFVPETDKELKRSGAPRTRSRCGSTSSPTCSCRPRRPPRCSRARVTTSPRSVPASATPTSTSTTWPI